MDSLTYTFSNLKDLLALRLTSGTDIAPTSVPNLHSALDAFMAERGFALGEVIASSMRACFQRHISLHVGRLAADGRTKEYISNRKSLLQRWRQLLLDFDRSCAASAGRKSPFQTALHELVAHGRTVKGTAQDCNVPLATFKRWMRGASPNARSVRGVPRVERFFGLPPGTLTDLLYPGKSGQPRNAMPEKVTNRYRERLKVQSTDVYAIKTPNDMLRQQWDDLIRFKTGSGHVRLRADGPRLKRAANGQWSMTNRPVKPATKSNWFAFKGNQYVATADVNWNFVSQYFGWLMRDVAQGGKAMSESDALTLANFMRDDLIDDYIDWRIQRSEGTNSGVITFLTFASSLCNPRTGFLAQQHLEYGPFLHISSEAAWMERSTEVHAHFAASVKDHKERVELSRDPFESIGTALTLANPLDAVADAVNRMNANRPLTGGRYEAVWARDKLLLKLLASNPLRDKNLRMLTYRTDGTGHLRKIDGVWRIHIPKSEFKNAKGAAKHRTYDMPVRREVWADIERYLRDYWRMLAPVESEYVFASREGGLEPMKSLRRRFAIITKRYFTGTSGFGPHGMRHIVATSILKLNPNDWAAAAWALHDLPETVQRHYAHLRSDDSQRWLETAMNGPFARMA